MSKRDELLFAASELSAVGQMLAEADDQEIVLDCIARAEKALELMRTL